MKTTQETPRFSKPARRVYRALLALAVTLGSLALAPRGHAAGLGSLTLFPVPPIFGTPCVCQGIAVGSDHNLWFTELEGNLMGRITVTGTVAQPHFPFSINPAGEAWVASGPDGALWVTLSDPIGAHSKIGRITTGGATTVFPIPGHSIVNGIAAGPDGALWFTDRLGSVDRISITGTVSIFSTGPGTQPYQITSGPDGNLWFTDFNRRLGKITLSGHITFFTPNIGNGLPDAITTGPDGALWFSVDGQNARIGRITTAGAITFFPLPRPQDSILVQGLVTGPDGNLWFTMNDGTTNQGAIGRMTTGGQVSEMIAPPSGRSNPNAPLGLTVGPDKALWFGVNHGKIGRFVLSS